MSAKSGELAAGRREDTTLLLFKGKSRPIYASTDGALWLDKQIYFEINHNIHDLLIDVFVRTSLKKEEEWRFCDDDMILTQGTRPRPCTHTPWGPEIAIIIINHHHYYWGPVCCGSAAPFRAPCGGSSRTWGAPRWGGPACGWQLWQLVWQLSDSLPVDGPQVLEVILLGQDEDHSVVAVAAAGVHLAMQRLVIWQHNTAWCYNRVSYQWAWCYNRVSHQWAWCYNRVSHQSQRVPGAWSLDSVLITSGCVIRDLCPWCQCWY